VLAAALLLLASGCTDQTDQTLVFARSADSVGLDPALEGDGESFKVCDNLYENLVAYCPESTDLRPQLARSWEASSDQLTWTFHLRTDVRFHDGTPFDAAAMLFSLGRQFYRDHPFHRVEGTYRYWKDMGMDAVVAAMEAPDDSTFVIRLREPYAPFLSNLAMNFCAAVSPTAVQRHGSAFFKNPVGTGPFRLQEWQRDERLVLARNESYWGARPALGRLIYRAIPEASVAYLELRRGSVHGLDSVSPEHVAAIRADPSLQLLAEPGMNVAYLAMNTEKPPFDQVLVRRALNHAVDRQSLAANLYQGLAVPAVNPVPPTVWAHNDTIVPYAHDPGRARELLRQAGFPSGFDTELWVMPMPRPYMPQPTKVAEAIQADLARVGIRARLVQFEWGTYLDKVYNGEHPLALLGWTGDNGDPDNFLYVLLDKDAATKPGQNIAFYRSEPVHELLVAARRTSDRAARAHLYRAAQEIIHSDAPWVPLVHAAQVVALRAQVRGFRLHPAGIQWFHSVYLAR